MLSCGKCQTKHASFDSGCPKRSKTGPPSALDLRKLSLVASMIENTVRDDNKALSEENEYRVQETDYYFKRMVSAYQRLDAAEARCRTAEATILRLRTERDSFAERSAQLEMWLYEGLVSTEQIDLLLSTRIRPDSPVPSEDSDVTIMEELMGP